MYRCTTVPAMNGRPGEPRSDRSVDDFKKTDCGIPSLIVNPTFASSPVHRNTAGDEMLGCGFKISIATDGWER